VKRISCYLPIFLVLLGIPLAARAQGPSFDVAVGFGTNYDKSNNAGIDNANSENAFGSCTPGTGDTDCQTTPALDAFDLGGSGDVMFRKNLGFGFEGVFQPVAANYGPLTYRQTFYDFNAIFAPVNAKRVSLKIEGGVGGAKTSFYLSQSECVGNAVCSKYTELIGDSNHFAIHASAGVQIYVTEHVFIRPQFDYRFVPGFTDQFSSDSVLGGSVWLGYSFGDR
jgi:opacity protein-like surface antigen